MNDPYAGKKGQPNVTETIISTSWRHNQARRKICEDKYILIEDLFMKQELFLLGPKKLCRQVVITGHLTKNFLLPSGPKSTCDPTGNPISVGPVSSWRHSRTETIERLFVCSSKHYSPRTSDYVCSQTDESNKRGV